MIDPRPEVLDDTRQRLVQAAIDVFVEKGYGGTRVADIAERAGFTPGALYVHFSSRTALLGAALVEEGERILNNLVDGLTDLTPGEGAIASAMSLGVAEPASTLDRLLLDALALAARDHEAREMLGKTLDRFTTMLGEKVSAGQETNLVDRRLDPAALKVFFSSWILGMTVVRSVNLGNCDPDAFGELCLRVTSAFLPASNSGGN